MPEEIPTKYCRRIKSNVFAEKSEDMTERIYVQCKYYDSWQGDCIFPTHFLVDYSRKKCLVKLTVERERKNQLSSNIFK